MYCRSLPWPALVLALVAASPAHAQSPQVTSFTPESGPPGTVVNMIGEHLDGVSAVYFQGIAAPEFVAISSEHLRAVVPEGARTGMIAVLDRGGLRTYSLKPFVVPKPETPPFSLELPTPSPATRNLTIGFSLSAPGRARLSVMDLRAQPIRVLVDDDFPAGPHVRSWDGRDGRGRRAPGGLYFIQLEAGGKRLVRRTLLVPSG